MNVPAFLAGAACLAALFVITASGIWTRDYPKPLRWAARAAIPVLGVGFVVLALLASP